jgi:predicted RNase H-like nuclease (RuvC/YqgF family)
LDKEFKELKAKKKNDELVKKVGELEKIIQRLVKEIQELRAEIKEQKQKGNVSEYQSYYLNRQESQLKDREQKLEKLSSIVNSNSNSNNFPTGLVVGGGILATLGLVVVLIAKKHKKKKR